MKENRRNFLKKSCGALTMTALATQMRHFGLMHVAAQEKMAQDKIDGQGSPAGNDYKALVCVFLSGGNDSNNMIIPNYDEGYNQYAAARSSQQLAIPRANLLPVTPPSMGGQVYGFHPSMTDMHTLWGQGKMAVVCNVGSLTQPITREQYQTGAQRPYQLFSHSDQVEQFRTAVSTHKMLTGWGGRVADRTTGLNTGAAIPMITSIAGATVFNVGNNTSPLIVSPSPTPLNQVLTLNGYPTTPIASETARREAMNNIRGMDLNYTMIQNTSLETQKALNVAAQLSQDPPLTVTFPNTTLGNQLRQVAKIMKFRAQLNMSRQIFYVQLGGFDTHTGQINGQGGLLTQVSQAIKAFYDETVAQGIANDVTTFTVSDFNRTFNPGATGANAGSDHAWAGHHIVVGGSVVGGNFYGRPTTNGTFFPTLVNNGPDDAETRGRFIPSVAIEQYSATLARWYGLAETDIPLVFPNINNFSGANLGFLG